MAKRNYRGRRRAHPLRPLLLTILVAAGALGVYEGNHTLQTEYFTVEFSSLPDGFDGCRIVHLSDLHGATYGENNEELFAAIRSAQPDYIVITGDTLDRFRETPHSYAVQLCTALMDIAPTYFVTGNHEWALPNIRGLKDSIAQTGVVVLSNEFVALERGGDAIVLAGIDDPNGYADQKTPEQLAEEIYEAYGDPFWMMLAHRNNYFAKRYYRLGADLVLSGHAHGGMIRLPGTDGLIGVERELFPSFTAGLYEVDGAKLFVSRGLGNSGPSFRMFNRPQVAVLTLKRG